MGAKGERLAVKFRVTVDDLDQYVTVTAAVRTLTPGAAGLEEGPSVLHGVEFVEVPPQDSLALAAFVYQKLLEQSVEV
jgi:hypothetical protein